MAFVFLLFVFSESFDVYNIETALPKLDIDAIENHLRAAKEAERRVSICNTCFSPRLRSRCF